MTSIPQETVASPAITQSDVPRWRRLIPKRWYAHVVLSIACFGMGIPLIYAIIVSTQGNADVFAYRFTFGEQLARNWDIVMNQRNLGQFMLNSAFVAVVMTTAKAIFSLLAGLAFVYFRFPGKWLVFGFVLLTLMMPTEVMAIALFRIVSGLGWGNEYSALIVPFMASATGVFLFRQHFANIPAELSEAAQMDGATPLQFLFRVLIPISWNAIAALCVIQFLYAWNQYIWPLMIIQDRSRQVVQLGLRTLIAGIETGDSFGPIMLGAVVASIPPLLVFILLQKQFMSGFALTRDK
ncbi:MAG: carbohydrate ABC transporter permease [Anaerolineae bacterium]|nr:carbohydrate ABC transporter permease [Anaerolineae bacterium]